MNARNSLDQTLQDLRYALRLIRKNPAFTGVAVLSLALGIGANTAIFTFVNAALLAPLPYPQADRIVALLERPPQAQGTTSVHPRSFIDWHDHARSFEALAIAQSIPVNTDGAEGAEQVAGLWTTAGLFRVFGVAPVLGRAYADGEGFNRSAIRGESKSGTSGVVLSHGYWSSASPARPC